MDTTLLDEPMEAELGEAHLIQRPAKVEELQWEAWTHKERQACVDCLEAGYTLEETITAIANKEKPPKIPT